MPAKTIVLFQGGRPVASAAAAAAGRGHSQPGKHLYLSVDTIANARTTSCPRALLDRGRKGGVGGRGQKWIARRPTRSVF